MAFSPTFEAFASPLILGMMGLAGGLLSSTSLLVLPLNLEEPSVRSGDAGDGSDFSGVFPITCEKRKKEKEIDEGGGRGRRGRGRMESEGWGEEGERVGREKERTVKLNTNRKE